MNKDHQDIEKITKGLLRKSLLRPSTPDFDDLLMNKIQSSPLPVKQHIAGNSLKKAWQFLLLAVICFIGSLLILSGYSGSYYSDISGLLEVTANYILYGGMALFIPLVLYHFDSLIYTFFLSKNKNVSLS